MQWASRSRRPCESGGAAAARSCTIEARSSATKGLASRTSTEATLACSRALSAATSAWSCIASICTVRRSARAASPTATVLGWAAWTYNTMLASSTRASTDGGLEEGCRRGCRCVASGFRVVVHGGSGGGRGLRPGNGRCAGGISDRRRAKRAYDVSQFGKLHKRIGPNVNSQRG